VKSQSADAAKRILRLDVVSFSPAPILRKLWGSQLWLQPPFQAAIQASRDRLKAGCGRDCPMPHSFPTIEELCGNQVGQAPLAGSG